MTEQTIEQLQTDVRVLAKHVRDSTRFRQFMQIPELQTLINAHGSKSLRDLYASAMKSPDAWDLAKYLAAHKK